jgi:CHAD domain-containing protein
MLDEEKTLESIAQSISPEWDNISSWCRLSNNWKSLGQGLRQTYRKAKQAYQAADADPAIPKLHEWRKQMKYLRHQLELLAPVNEKAMTGRIKLARRLGDILGDDHDLAALRDKVADLFENDGQDRGEFIELLENRRSELVDQARRLGRRFFRRPVSSVLSEIKDNWKAWRHCKASA